MSGLPDIPRRERHKYTAADICIYCGDESDLTDEPIVPFGLGGNLVLPSSSYRECARVTGRFEGRVLRGPLRPVRVIRRIQSRRKHRGAPTELPLRVRMEGGDWETVRLTLEECPILVQFFLYDVPGHLDHDAYEGGVRVRGQATFSFGPRPEEVMARLGAKQIRMSNTDVPGAFAKMTAKVAYAMAVAEGQIDPHQGRPRVASSIIDDSKDIGMWVGNYEEPRRIVDGAMHVVYVERNTDLNLLMGRVQYLADVGTPVYSVILAPLDSEFVAPS